ncbi:MAG: hypothetical protein ACREYF_24355 [Gammaproteobacteria bacterium]
MLKLLDTSKLQRNKRWDEVGLLNDPYCKQATKPDQFGFMLDECRDPYSTGVGGLRLKPNPAFKQEEWDALGKAAAGTGADGFLAGVTKTFKLTVGGRAVEKHGWEVEPPYLPSLTCVTCYLAPNPLNPPKDLHNPKWNEMVFALGNQYLREGGVLGYFWPEDDFVHEVLAAQPPGTSDTSRFATDNINNPNTINTIANLGARPLHIERVPTKNSVGGPFADPDRIDCKWLDNPELNAAFPKTVGGLLAALVSGKVVTPVGDLPITDVLDPKGQRVPTARILKDGADSSGPTGALLRVYINIGSCVDQFERAAGGKLIVSGRQSPISRLDLYQTCVEYRDMNQRVLDTFAYLAYVQPYRLADAPDGASRIDQSKVARGQEVFAEACATCHSSIQPNDPNFDEHEPATWFTPERIAFVKNMVAEPHWKDSNFFADDRRYPVDLIGTNVARAYSTNAARGHVWEEYASDTYRQLPSVKSIDREIGLPFGLSVTYAIEPGGGGRGYYRTPTLINLWNGAPFLHNNGLGSFNGDPSVAGRLAAFDDAAQKLLGLKARDGKSTVRRTKRTTNLMGVIPILKDWPIDRFANLGLLLAPPTADTSFLQNLNPLNLVDRLKAKIVATDPVQDHGHDGTNFGGDLLDEDKRALIEFLKTI